MSTIRVQSAGSELSSPIAPELEGQTITAKQAITPLPKLQLAVICFISFSEPISSFVIFPFVNEMIEFNGITHDPKRVGYYTGMIECLFFFTQTLTVLFWGSLSDKVGRKPVLLIGLCGSIMAIVSFGLATSLEGMIFARCIAGALNGNSAVIRSAVAEITDSSNEALAFSIIPICWSVASILAPVIGGFLARPAENFPGIFGNWNIFIQYPYLLPCISGASISVLGLLSGLFFMKETLVVKPNCKARLNNDEPQPNYGAIPSSDSNAPAVIKPSLPIDDPQHSILELLCIPTLRSVLISYLFVAYITISIDALWSLWMFTPVGAGGLGFTTSQIGISLAGIGILSAVVGLVIFPPVQRRLGTKPIYVAAMTLQCVLAASFPVVHLIAVSETHNGTQSSAMVQTWVGVWFLVFIKGFATVIYSCNLLLLNSSVPSRSSLGVVNGLAQMIASIMRTIGPVISTSLFAATMSQNLVGGYLIWIYLVLMSSSGILACLNVRQTTGGTFR